MKIGILGEGFMEWAGGIDFLRIVAESLMVADPNIELHFLFPTSGPYYESRMQYRRLKRIVNKSLGRPYADSTGPSWHHIEYLVSSIGGNSYAHRIDAGMRSLRKATEKYKIDVLLPSIIPLKKQNVPWIGYLYDYQHAYYPEFFSTREIENRKVRFQAMLCSASHVIVNAQAVADDIERFNPDHRAEIVTLPFSASPNPKWLELESADLEKYEITRPYFMISNQFWQHKDHATAWHALALLSSQNIDIQLICTGETHDNRNPTYFTNLMKLAEDLGIKDRIRILGLIPKNEQIRLMRSAVALVQPSLFEGGAGGGAVYDAVSLGISSIISDTKVNLELDEIFIEFFKAKDPKSLAEKMHKLLNQHHSKIRKSSELLLKAGENRRRQCGIKLMQAIKSLSTDKNNSF